jgi:Mrp family chromosome partitioning ATPase
VPPNPLELIERSTFGLVISELASKFDHVVVDTSAASFGSDAFVIAARCTATLMLARRHQTRVDALREMAAASRARPTQLAGVIINDH